VKSTFDNLSEKKKLRVINACIEEFSEHGYELGSMDGIIKRAGISKGGLYQYVSSKEELFTYIVDYTYTSLYSYLKQRVAAEIDVLPSDLLDRLKHVSELAIDFYIDHPKFVYLIVRTANQT
jgi:TetR/AcrR family transcriptional regulator